MQGMTTPFQISPYTIDDLGSRQTSIRIAVLGYWSADVINVYVRRGWGDEGQWEFEISHSSGGRDRKEVCDDDEAEQNFAFGLLEACKIVKDLKSKVADLEAAYQIYKQQLTAEYEAHQAAKLAKIEADMPIGEHASLVMTALQQEAENNPGVEAVGKFYERGSDKVVKVTAVKLGRLSFRVDGIVTKRQDAVAKIAKLSARDVA